ncbi:MAG: hypothetical protein HY718_13250 [Planctomycetes bacterium]|nr:hypothetical protein [Planctomycetota bacterium]
MDRRLSRVVASIPFLIAADGARTAPPDTRPANQPAGRLVGFEASPHFGEQIREFRIEPGVQIHVNAPAPEKLRPDRLTRLMFFALPNGNTTAQTIGRKMTPGLDWHYDIQHIGAQTRRLREVVTTENLVVTYLEADGRSWAGWRTKHPAEYGLANWKVIETVRDLFKPYRTVVELSGHSGGGSFIFGCIDGVAAIPDDVRRISFLDSNYNYTDEAHGDKLVAWLKARPDHCLTVICYDDRNVVLNGKPIVSSTGGTYRRTEQMAQRLRRDFPLIESNVNDSANDPRANDPHPSEPRRSASGPASSSAPLLLRYRGLDGRIDLILHRNPNDKILHTALVGPMNGFIHAMTVGTPYENKAAIFNGPAAYVQYIQR